MSCTHHIKIPISHRYFFVVRDGVVETPSRVWKTHILTVIRIPQYDNYNRLARLNIVFGDRDDIARLGGTFEQLFGDEIFDGALDDTAHRTGTETRIVTNSSQFARSGIFELY